jgi:hypothetical protein
MVFSKCNSVEDHFYYMGKERMKSVNCQCFEDLTTECPMEGTIFYFSCFKDKEEYNAYINLVDRIKMTIAGINDEHADGKILSAESYKTKLEKRWIPLVKELFSRFGEDMIPHDVQWTCNDVLESLKKPRHKWTTQLAETTREDVAKTQVEYKILYKPAAPQH